MAASTLMLKWRDYQGRETTLGYNVGSAYPPGDADLLALIQALQNMSQANIVEAWVLVSIDPSGLTGSQPVESGSFDAVGDQAQLQFDRADNTGKVKITIPAPLDTLFVGTGPYALADIDTADSLVAALVTAGITEPVLVSPQEGALTLDKGWRKGQKHS